MAGFDLLSTHHVERESSPRASQPGLPQLKITNIFRHNCRTGSSRTSSNQSVAKMIFEIELSLLPRNMKEHTPSQKKILMLEGEDLSVCVQIFVERGKSASRFLAFEASMEFHNDNRTQ